MKLDLQGKLFDQTERRAAGPDTAGGTVANGEIEATLTLSVGQLEALVEPLVRRAVERALAERMPSAAVPSHVPVAVAARLLGMAPKTVSNMLSDGRLTRYGAPRRPLVSLEEIEAITHRRGRERAPLAAVRSRPGQGRPRGETFAARARAG